MDRREVTGTDTTPSSTGTNQQVPGATAAKITPFISSKSLIPPASSSQKSLALSSPHTESQRIVSRNSNGTVVLTSSPSNEAELQLFRVMQRASLLAYYDTLLEMGGDDVQQLCDAGEEEFLEIMALVGMASKPLHVRRLQKALQEWVTSPALFQIPLTQTPPTSLNPQMTIAQATSAATMTQTVTSNLATSAAKETIRSCVSPDGNQVTTEMDDHGSVLSRSSSPSPTPAVGIQEPTSPSLSGNPCLTEWQISKLTEVAEILVKTLPHFEPKPHNTKKKICRSLDVVMTMSEDDPRRMEEIRKYSAIYGRFDCKRNPQKPLTLHEVSVNEAAAQICRFAPALLTRRDDLFSLARQVVRDSGYQFSKTHSGYVSCGKTWNSKTPEDGSVLKKAKLDVTLNCDSSDAEKSKRQDRLEQIAAELKILGFKTDELVRAAQQVRQTNDLSSVQKLQQEMEAVQNKQTELLVEQSELLRQPLPSRFYRRNGSSILSNQSESDKPDLDDTDSQFSLSNASSPSLEAGDLRQSLLRDGDTVSNIGINIHAGKSPSKSINQVFRADGLNGFRNPEATVNSTNFSVPLINKENCTNV